MGSTTRGAFPFPDGTSNWKQIRAELRALAQAAADKTALYLESTAATRPAPGTAGRLHRATDTDVITWDTGTAWIDVNLTRAAANAAYAPRLYRGVRVELPAGQSIPASTLTVIGFTAESWDDGGWHDNATNNSRLTVPAGIPAGKFALSGVLGMDGSGGTFREVYLRKNTTIITSIHVTPAPFGRYLVAEEVDAQPGDYFDMMISHDNATALTANGVTHLTAHYIGASS